MDKKEELIKGGPVISKESSEKCWAGSLSNGLSYFGAVGLSASSKIGALGLISGFVLALPISGMPSVGIVTACAVLGPYVLAPAFEVLSTERLSVATTGKVVKRVGFASVAVVSKTALGLCYLCSATLGALFGFAQSKDLVNHDLFGSAREKFSEFAEKCFEMGLKFQKKEEDLNLEGLDRLTEKGAWLRASELINKSEYALAAIVWLKAPFNPSWMVTETVDGVKKKISYEDALKKAWEDEGCDALFCERVWQMIQVMKEKNLINGAIGTGSAKEDKKNKRAAL